MSTLPEVAPRLTVELVDLPTWISARMIFGRNQETRLSVYVSPLVEWTDEIFQPVIRMLDRHCTTMISKDTLIDPDMMFGEGIAYSFEILPFCPGRLVQHECCSIDTTTPRGGVID